MHLIFSSSSFSSPTSHLFAESKVPSTPLAVKVDASIIGIVGGVLAASTLSLFALSRFSQRVIGQMAVNRAAQELKLSYLTFWGRRRDMIVPASALPQSWMTMTVEEQLQLTQTAFFPFPLRLTVDQQDLNAEMKSDGQDEGGVVTHDMLLSLRYAAEPPSQIFKALSSL
eukprot:m.198952 g.198952  ORF g.198952 m.198952 type:complete len:170 (-) comp14928_c0_seq1:2140-2649(-)